MVYNACLRCGVAVNMAPFKYPKTTDGLLDPKGSCHLPYSHSQLLGQMKKLR